VSSKITAQMSPTAGASAAAHHINLDSFVSIGKTQLHQLMMMMMMMMALFCFFSLYISSSNDH
jgi:hypothetical protein